MITQFVIHYRLDDQGSDPKGNVFFSWPEWFLELLWNSKHYFEKKKKKKKRSYTKFWLQGTMETEYLAIT